MTRECRRVRIRGRVQGVGFRAWLRGEAEALGLSGWVRNRRDGSVEAVLAGEGAALDRLTARCRVGPPAATVEGVDVEPCPDEPTESAGVSQRPTA